MKKIVVTNQVKSFKDFFTITFQLIIASLPFFLLDLNGTDPLCIITFAINGILFIFGMFLSQKKHSISIELVYWIFMFFFMYYAPIIQYILDIYPWKGSLNAEDVIKTNIIIFVFSIFFVLGERLAKITKVKGVPRIEINDFICSNFEFKKRAKIIMTSIVIFLAAYSFYRTGLFGIVVSRVNATQVFYSGDSSAIELIVESVIPALIAYTVSEAAQEMMKKKKLGLRFVVLLICLLICCFPTAIPRYKTATIYGTIFLVLFPKLKKGIKFYWLFVFAMFFAFPLLNAFRYIISFEKLISVFENGIISVYTEADYDAYRMLSSSVKYVGKNGAVFGRQLLGVLLFFVPSAIWKGKPGGSGALLIRDELGSGTVSNVSCPYIGEGYLNFGIIGAILFAMLLGIIVYKADKVYWKKNGEKEHLVFSPYLFLVFMIFFVMRGDLLSGFAYVCGFMATGYMLKIAAKYL